MIKAIFHIIVALAVFASSAGLTITNHYCQLKLVKTSFLEGSDHWCKGKISDPCANAKMSCNNRDETSDKDCCKTESKYFKLDQTQDIEQIEIRPFDKKEALNAIIPIYTAAFKSTDKRTLQYLNYSPPLIFFDHQVTLQTFRC